MNLRVVAPSIEALDIDTIFSLERFRSLILASDGIIGCLFSWATTQVDITSLQGLTTDSSLTES